MLPKLLGLLITMEVHPGRAVEVNLFPQWTKTVIVILYSIEISHDME